MKISAIISRTRRAVQTIGHDRRLIDAVMRMHESNVGSIVVVHAKTGALLGLLSQPEILNGVATFGASGIDHCVTGIMRKPAPACGPDDSAAIVMRRMTEERCRHMVVTDGNETILGIISIGDLVAAQLRETQLEAGVLRDMARSRMFTGPAMTRG